MPTRPDTSAGEGPKLGIPKAISTVSGLTLKWDAEHLQVDIERLHEHSDGHVTGEVKISTSAPGFDPHLLRDHLNLSSSVTRQRTTKLLLAKYNHVDWDSLLEMTSEYALAYLRRERPVEVIETYEDSAPPAFDLFPFLVKAENNMLYSDGGGGKSYLALLFTILVELPWLSNPFGWGAPETRINVLYLDYERSKRTQAWRMHCLTEGFDLAPAPLYYQRCHTPFANDTHNIQLWVNQVKADVIIVDSIAPAAGGDMNKTEPALAFFSGLGSLICPNTGTTMTSLLLAHTSKDITTSRKTPYGNAFWRNECSNVWELISSLDESTGQRRLRLRHDKYNDFPRQGDMGLVQSFGPSRVSYELSQLPEPQPSATGHEQLIWECLSLPRSPADIASLTGIKPRVVSTILGDMKKDGYVFSPSYGLWQRARPLNEDVEP